MVNINLTKKLLEVLLVAFAIALLGGCAQLNTIKLSHNATATPTVTPPPALILPTLTTEPLGSRGNPLVLAVTANKSTPQMVAGLIELAARLKDKTGYNVTTEVDTTANWLITGMLGAEVEIAFLPPASYIWASQEKIATVALLTNHFGVYGYGIQFLANKDSLLTVFYDPSKNSSPLEPNQALSQFSGRIPCWVSPTSLAGFVAPQGYLLNQHLAKQPGIFMNSSTALIRALYVKGICDFGATFSTIGDPRTAQDLLADFPDILDKVVIIWQSPAVIPSMNISYLASLPVDMQSKLTQAFLDIQQEESGKEVLTAAAGYDIQGLKVVEDSAYDPLRNLIEKSQVELSTLIGQ